MQKSIKLKGFLSSIKFLEDSLTRKKIYLKLEPVRCLRKLECERSSSLSLGSAIRIELRFQRCVKSSFFLRTHSYCGVWRFLVTNMLLLDVNGWNVFYMRYFFVIFVDPFPLSFRTDRIYILFFCFDQNLLKSLPIQTKLVQLSGCPYVQYFSTLLLIHTVDDEYIVGHLFEDFFVHALFSWSCECGPPIRTYIFCFFVI